MIRIDFNVDREDLYHFGWMLLFILGIYVFANYIVMKDLDQYIEMKNRYSFQKTLQRYVQENTQSAQLKYADYKSFENYLMTMGQRYSKETLLKLMGNYFKVDRLELVDRKKREGVVEERYLVRAFMKTPRPFFDFLQDIKTKSLPFKVEKPIQFEKNGGLIVTFELSVYTMQ